METKDSELDFGKLSESTAQATRDGSYSLAATLAIMAYNIRQIHPKRLGWRATRVVPIHI